MDKNLMAFWKYDRFPYLLCGVIDEVRDDGLVKIGSYGNALFRPQFIIPEEAGLKLKEQLNILEAKHEQDLKAVLENNKEEANKLLSKFKYQI
jgi:hypothetical protein